MKKLIPVALFLLSFGASAASFDCRYFLNLEEIHRNAPVIADGAKNVEIAELGDYTYFITSLGDSKFELQALNSPAETRTYAVSQLGAGNPELGLVIWKRDGIAEVRCSL